MSTIHYKSQSKTSFSFEIHWMKTWQTHDFLLHLFKRFIPLNAYRLCKTNSLCVFNRSIHGMFICSILIYTISTRSWISKHVHNSFRMYILDITYHGFAMREVSVNSTSLYETNSFSIKGFSCLFSHRSHRYWFCLKKLNVFSQNIGQKTKGIFEFRRTNLKELKCW